MMYRVVTAPLASALPQELRILAGVRLRAVHGVVSAAVEDRRIRVWHSGPRLAPAAQRWIRRCQDEAEARGAEPTMADYRRDALISVGIFAAMKIL